MHVFKLTAKLFNVLTTILTIAVLVIAGTFTIPRIFGIVPYIVQSGSMEPVIQTGSAAFINTKDTNCTTGDIITYQIAEETLVTHRVQAINADGSLVTKGDANDIADLNSVMPEQVVGTYLFSVPYAGYVLAKLNGKGLIIVAAWIAFLNITSILLSNAASDDREERKDKTETDK